jgi:hypothetical protein
MFPNFKLQFLLDKFRTCHDTRECYQAIEFKISLLFKNILYHLFGCWDEAEKIGKNEILNFRCILYQGTLTEGKDGSQLTSLYEPLKFSCIALFVKRATIEIVLNPTRISMICGLYYKTITIVNDDCK